MILKTLGIRSKYKLITFATFNLEIKNVINYFALIIRLDNGTVIGLLGEIRHGYFDTSVTGSFPTLERFDAVEFTQGLFPTKMGIFIRRPSKNDVSMRYFIMGK